MSEKPRLMRACFTCGVINMELQGKLEGLRIENEKLILENRRLKRLENNLKSLRNKNEAGRQAEFDLERIGHHAPEVK